MKKYLLTFSTLILFCSFLVPVRAVIGNESEGILKSSRMGSDVSLPSDDGFAVDGLRGEHWPTVQGDPSDLIWTHYIFNASINGVSLQEGDELAIFDGDLLVGSLVLPGVPTGGPDPDFTLKAWHTLIGGPGFTPGNPFNIKCWDASEEIEVEISSYTFIEPGFVSDVFPDDNESSAVDYYFSAVIQIIPELVNAVPGDEMVSLSWQSGMDGRVVENHWPPVQGDPSDLIWTIYVFSAALEGVSLEEGDELAIYDGNKLVGSLVLPGTPPGGPNPDYTLKAWHTLNSGPGFTPGNDFTIKCWDASEQTESSGFTYTFLDGGYLGDVFPDDNESTAAQFEFTEPEPYVPSFNLYFNDGELIEEGLEQYTYNVPGLTNGIEYCFYVTQMLPDGSESTPSNILCATPVPPPSPQLLDAVAGPENIELQWEPLPESDVVETHWPAIFGDPSDLIWNIYIFDSDIDDIPMEAGDELAIFDGDLLVGSFVMPGPPPGGINPNFTLKAWKTLVGGPGYTPGNAFSIRCWDASEQTEISGFAYTFLEGGYIGDVFPDDNVSTAAEFNFFAFEPYIPTFNIYADDGTLIEAGVEGNSYLVEGLDPGQEYCFYITQVLSGGGESGQSNIQCAIPLLACNNAVANAGEDATIADNESHILSGATAQYYESLLWVSNGDGSFDDPALLNPEYSPGPTDIQNGYVELCLTAFAADGCDDATNCIQLAIEPFQYFEKVWTTPFSPMSIYVLSAMVEDVSLSPGDEIGIFDVDPNSGGLVCVGNAEVGEEFNNGDFLEIICSMDDGSNPDQITGFQPGNSFIFQFYINSSGTSYENVFYSFPYPGYDEVFEPLGNAFVDLMYTNVNCEDAMADAGEDVTICENSVLEVSTAVADNFESLLWTSTGDGTFDDPAVINPVYYYGVQDLASGSVELCLTASAFFPCEDATDCMMLTIQASPTANAGDDISVCADQSAQLNGSATNFSSILWFTQGDGEFSDQFSLTTEYVPGFNDLINGHTDVCLIAGSIDPCEGASDCLTISFQSLPEVDAGEDQVICAGEEVFLDGSAGNFASVQWITDGDGTFNDAGLLNAVYYPGDLDNTLGFAQLCLNAAGIAPCADKEDCMVISIYSAPELIFAAPGNQQVTLAWAPAEVLATYNIYMDGSLYASGISETTYIVEGLENGTEYCFYITEDFGGGEESCPSNTLCATPVIPPAPTLLQANAGNELVDLIWEPIAPAESVGDHWPEVLGDPSDLIWSIYIFDAVLNDVELEAGDELAIFDGDLLVGSLMLPGTPPGGPNPDYVLKAWKTLVGGPGYTPGNDFSVKCWDASESIESTSFTYNFLNGGYQGDVFPDDNQSSAAEFGFTGFEPYAPAFNIYFSDGTLIQPEVVGTTCQVTGLENDQEYCFYITQICADGTESAISNVLCATPFLNCNHAEAFAGEDDLICEGDPYALTGATAQYYTSLVWTTTGDGVFDNPTVLNPVYSPGVSDLADGSVELCLKAIAEEPCDDAIDCMILDFQPVPVVYAGEDSTIGSFDTYQFSQAAASNYDQILWTTSGDGTFDDPTLLNPVYEPGQNDIDNGGAEICITVDAIEPCENISDCMVLTIEPGQYFEEVWTTPFNPMSVFILSAEFDQVNILAGDEIGIFDTDPNSGNEICVGAAVVGEEFLNGDYIEIICSMDDGSNPNQANGFTPGSDFIFKYYIPGAGLVEPVMYTFPYIGYDEVFTPLGNAIVDLNASSSGCFDAIAVAGEAVLICEGDQVILSGEAENYISVLWQTTGDGYFEDPTVLSTIYFAGVNDLATGNVELCLNAFAQSPCANDSDCLQVEIINSPTVVAGDDAVICADAAFELSEAFADNFSSLLWSGGDGQFDDNTLMNPTYEPGVDDKAAGEVSLCLSAEPLDPCTLAATDCMTLTIVPLPFAFAGEDAVICSDGVFVLDDAYAKKFSSFVWTGGDGYFDDPTSMNPAYFPGAEDIVSGEVTLCLTAEPLDPCTLAASDCFILEIVPLPFAYAGDDATICANDEYQLSDAFAENFSSLLWSGGDGQFDDKASLNPTYEPGVEDITAGEATLCLSAEPLDPCTLTAIDCLTLNIVPLPTAFAEADAEICADGEFDLAEASAENYSSLLWTGGDGNFNDPATMHPTYTPGAEDIATGEATLCLTAAPLDPCTLSATDCLILNIVPLPTVFAGADAEICATGEFDLAEASAENYSSLLWTGGDGNFNDPATMHPTYTPGAEDIATGEATLCLTAAPLNPCTISATDCLILNIVPQPTAFAGADAEICATGEFDLTEASAENYGSLLWTGADGSFNNPATLHPTYTPGAEDIASGEATLCLTAAPLDPCTLSATDCLILNIVPLPTAFAGADAEICATGEFDLTEASAENYSSLLWTGGDGSFNNPATLHPTYTPGAEDIATGEATLCLTAEPLDPCTLSATDCLILNIVPLPTAFAGPDAEICADGEFDVVEASAENYSSLLWTGGDGNFNNPATLHPAYTPGAEDIATGEATLCLTAAPLNPCTISATDCLILNIIQLPTAFAGADAEICATGEFDLTEAHAENYSSLLWTGGDGNFNDPATMHPTYTPGAEDIATGDATLCLTAAPLDPCTLSATDCLILNIVPLPAVFAGADAEICANGEFDLTEAFAENYSNILWSGGDGSFNNPATLHPTYTPGAEDIATGEATLCLTAEPLDPCTLSATDCLILNIVPLPTAFAGPDAEICADGEFDVVEASAENYSSLLWTGGDGNFNNPATLHPAYTPGAEDIATGEATLCLTAAPLDPCTLSVSDCLILNIIQLPTAFAGADAEICATGEFDLTEAHAENYSNILWTGGDGSFNDPSTMHPTYTPGAEDIASGDATLCLTAAPLDPCTISTTDCLILNIVQLPTAFAGADAEICVNGEFDLTEAFAENYSNILWSGGDGSFNDPATLHPTYTPGAEDIASGEATLCLTVQPLDPCSISVSDCIFLSMSPLPEVFAGNNAAICEGSEYVLEAAFVDNYSSVEWTGGDGEFSDVFDMNPTYTPEGNDLEDGFVELCLTAMPLDPCVTPVSDCLTISIFPSPVVNAGYDFSVCESETFLIVGAFATNYSSLLWTGGDGEFSIPNQSFTAYTPGDNDREQGFVECCLTAQPINPCTVSAMDCATITLLPLPEPNAGADAEICETESYELADATGENYSGVLWYGGGGSFEDPNELNTTYTPGSTDFILGFTELCLSLQPVNPCSVSVTDCMSLYIKPQPEVDAGEDINICVEETVQLSGYAQNYANVLWTTSGDGFFADNQSLSTYYMPASGDIASGNVVLTLFAGAIDPCTTGVTDALTVEITAQPFVSAGVNQFVCEDQILQLVGQAQNYSTVMWSSNGDGAFSNAYSLNTLYFPGDDDLENGLVSISLNAGPLDPCTMSAGNAMNATFISQPSVDAGEDITLCEGENLTLGGVAENYAAILWSTAGDGTFDDDTQLSGTYYPGNNDVSAGSVFLTLVAEAIQPCQVAATDVMKLNISNAPSADAGDDLTICENTLAALSGSAAGFSSIQWTTSGDGIFSNPGVLNVAYQPGPVDKASGSVEITLTAFPADPCTLPANDMTAIFFQALPTADAGPDVEYCYGEQVLFPQATFGNYAMVEWFTVTGNGSFDDPNAENPVYNPDPQNDYQAGCIILGVTAYPSAPCLGPGYTDYVKVCFQAPLMLNAGVDAAVCEGNPYILYTASAENYGDMLWTSDGDGAFVDASVLNAVYNPGTNDIVAGEVTLCLAGDPVSPCDVAQGDCMTLYIQPGEGPDLVVAEPGVEEVNLEWLPVGGEVNETGHWDFEGGNPTNLWTIVLNSVTLNGLNVEAGDELAIFDGDKLVGQKTLISEVEPGNYNQSLQAYLELVSGPGYTPGNPFIIKFWDHSLGVELMVDNYELLNPQNQGFYVGDVFPEENNESSLANLEFFNPDAPKFNLYYVDGTTILNETYALSYTDENLQPGDLYCYFVTQVYTDGSESCPSNIMCAVPTSPCVEPSVYAGEDQIICENGIVSLEDAVATDYEFIQWTSSGDGLFADQGSISTIYTPGPADIQIGNVQLCIAAVGFEPCGTETDCITVTFTKAPSIEIGLAEDQICFGADYEFVLTQGSNYSAIQWSTSGEGMFSNPSILNPTYVPDEEDFSLGCVDITVEASPVDPCSISAMDIMELCFVSFPDIDAGDDDFVCRGESFQLDAMAENYGYVLWLTAGDGTFSNPNILNPIYTPGMIDDRKNGVKLTLVVYPETPCTDIAVDHVFLGVYDCHETNIPQGWSGLSSYLESWNSDVEVMFESVQEELIILQDLYNSWWPAENFNTIGNWTRTDGYRIKVDDDVDFTVAGLPSRKLTVEMETGWNLIPVLSTCSADVALLFAQTDVIMVKEVAGWKLYWPQLGINTLETLDPGKAYYVLMGNEGAVKFPNCLSTKSVTTGHVTSIFDGYLIPDNWKFVERSAVSHTIGIPSWLGEQSGFDVGDVIGAVDGNGNCYGYGVWTGENINVSIFADDPVTGIKDGFYDGEQIAFVKYNPDTDEFSNLNVEFDPDFPNSKGIFVQNGISVLKAFTINDVSSDLPGMNDIHIYPNPVTENLVVQTMDYNNIEFRVLNLQGQEILSGELSGETTSIDVSSLMRGMYVIHLKGDATERIDRIVKY